ncbi:MAG: hypothetical protein B7Z10_01370 [Rhodobacterales bacterium 32-66-7]|nr:MAG: hypothetical protein B7Z10_01370 [Rhodobacterales bacterium 32-66-7]
MIGCSDLPGIQTGRVKDDGADGNHGLLLVQAMKARLQQFPGDQASSKLHCARHAGPLAVFLVAFSFELDRGHS